MGVVAIFASVAFVVLTLVPGNRQTDVLLGASAFLFLVGLVDDFLRLKGQVPPHPDRLKDDIVASATTFRSVIR
jgi:UDP-N-acetylmuramyl pentapeptide phosphotransferase/UDP-N-acetylglucosamine-1-phosphate transferase